MIPMKCIEYMACKKTFLTTPVSQDIIKNNDVGILLTRKFTKEEVNNKLTHLIEDTNLMKKLGENGYRKVKSTFKWEIQMNKLNSDIEKLIQ